MVYIADLGIWAAGRMIDIEVPTPELAVREAQELCNGDEEVFQVYEEESRRYVWDYMNGHRIYQDNIKR